MSVFEFFPNEYQQLIGMDLDEARQRILQYDNVFENSLDMDKSDFRGPVFFVRVLPWGSMATLDVREDRINIQGGKDGKVIGVSTG